MAESAAGIMGMVDKARLNCQPCGPGDRLRLPKKSGAVPKATHLCLGASDCRS